MNISCCGIRSNNSGFGAGEVASFIKENTTCEQFDAFLKERPNYRLNYGGNDGWNALGVAALVGNVALIHHIVRIGGKPLIHLGNLLGWTPLYCAANCSDSEKGLMAAKTLLSFGAEVNTATSLDWEGLEGGMTPKMATPLWAAASKAQNLNLVKFLLINGGVIDMTTTSGFFHPLYGEDRFPLPLINQATAQLREDRKIWKLFRVSQHHTKGVKLPRALILLIGKYFY